MTLVAGPPVEVQVKVLDWLLTVRLVTLGEPAWRYKQKVQMKFWTDHYKPGWSHWRDLASHPGSWYDATYDPASTATLAARLAITFTGKKIYVQ